jgi:predicted enzyme related to lactoylglutathione lyase
MRSRPLLRSIDCLQLPVPDLDEALAFYAGRLGHAVVWRTEEAVGLRLPDDGAELVLQVERSEPETDLMVDNVDAAVSDWTVAGGTVEVQPFEIQIGRCAVVRDPFGNRVVLLDASKGLIGEPR